MRPTVFLIALCAPLHFGCPPASSVAPPVSAEEEGLSGPITLFGPDAGVVARAVATRPDHWRIEDARGEKMGKLSVEVDRVKVKGLDGDLKGKIKRREGGLKIEDGRGRTLLKLKQKGPERFALEDDDGHRLGDVEGSLARWAETSLEARRQGAERVEVRRGEALELAAEGPVTSGAALLAAHPSLDPELRVGLLVFLYAVRPE
ncbi:MAG: hypothetical protein AAFZ18_34905 [Myxococcota bacterium]